MNKWEDDNKKIELLFGLKNDLKDYISFRTSDEKRDEILRESIEDPELRKQIKEDIA